jgi:hypothetical protein
MRGQVLPGIKGQCPLSSRWVEDASTIPLAPNSEQDPEIKRMIEEPPKSSVNKLQTLMESNKLNRTITPSNMISPNEQRRQTFDAGINPLTGRKPPVKKDMSMMQKLGANMKNPEWWSESISGLPSDTRLMRLGQLMNYYGKTPKGRQASDDPSKLWAANEAASAKIKATKDAAKAKSSVELYGKKTIADLTTELIPDVKEMFGDTFWGGISSNPNADDEEAMASIAGQVATNIKAMSLAFPNKTPGDIRKMALAKVAEDRDLDVY